MEIKYTFVIYIGIVLLIAFWITYIIRKKKNEGFSQGNRYGNLDFIEQNAYYKQQKIIYRIATIACVIATSMTIMSACVLASRLYTTQKVSEKQYSRDIIICMDISTSVDELNKNLANELKDTVMNLRGERIGIIIFNTSPVLVTPLTDDYEYVISELDRIEKSLKDRLKYTNSGIWNDKTYDSYIYLQEGTLVGNEERGSSLIGDGLASCVANFPKAESKRSKVIIFSTDNDPYGDCYFTLPEAAKLCKDNKIIVYGIGTKEMTQTAMDEMSEAVKSTGGQFYLEEESGTFEEIVNSIGKLSAGKTASKSFVTETDAPHDPFIWLVVSMIFMLGTLFILRK